MHVTNLVPGNQALEEGEQRSGEMRQKNRCSLQDQRAWSNMASGIEKLTAER